MQDNIYGLLLKKTVDIRIKENKNTSPVIKRTQFLLMLGWTGTVSKVQGF